MEHGGTRRNMMERALTCYRYDARNVNKRTRQGADSGGFSIAHHGRIGRAFTPFPGRPFRPKEGKEDEDAEEATEAMQIPWLPEPMRGAVLRGAQSKGEQRLRPLRPPARACPQIRRRLEENQGPLRQGPPAVRAVPQGGEADPHGGGSPHPAAEQGRDQRREQPHVGMPLMPREDPRRTRRPQPEGRGRLNLHD